MTNDEVGHLGGKNRAHYAQEMDDSTSRTASSVRAEHHDVIVVGAGISGIGAAYHLKKFCPDRTFTILEGAETSAARGIFSVTQNSAPIATCTPWATRSSVDGREVHR